MGLPARPRGGWSLCEREWATFVWPISTVSEFVRLLACPHGAPTGIVVGEFTASIRTAQAREGRIFISVDRRESLSGGIHCTCDFFLVAHLHYWADGVFGFVPCVHQLARDDCLTFKIADGRTFWGIMAFVYVYCVPTSLTFMEQPDTIITDCLLPSSVVFSPEENGDPYRKTIVGFTRGAPPLLFDPAVRVVGSYAGRRLHDFTSADERDRWRSSWQRYPRTCAHLVRSLRPASPPPAPIDFRVLAELFSVRWYLLGRTIPDWYGWQLGTPPPCDAVYQLMRGAGDGRVVAGVIPYSLRVPPQLVAQALLSHSEAVQAATSALLSALQPQAALLDSIPYVAVWGLLFSAAEVIATSFLALLVLESQGAQERAWSLSSPPQWVPVGSLTNASAWGGPTRNVVVGSLRRIRGQTRPRLPPTMGTLDCRADRATVLGCPFVLPRHADLLQRAAVVDGYLQWLDALLWAGEAAALPVAGTATLLPSLATQFAARLSLRLAPAWDSRDAAFLHSDQDVVTAVFRLVRHLDEVGDVRLLCWCQDVSDASPLRCHCCELAATALQLLSARVASRATAASVLWPAPPPSGVVRRFTPESDIPTRHLAGMAATSLVLIFICCLSSPLVYAHVDGISILGVALPPGASLTKTAQQSVCTILAASPLVIPVGRYLNGPAIVAVPLAADPPAAHVVRTRGRRLSLHAAGAGFVWCTFAALAMCISSDAASRAILGVSSFSGAVPMLADEWVGDASAGFEGFTFGRVAAAPLTPLSPFGGVFQTEGHAVEASFRSGRWLQEALHAATGDWASDLWQLADRITPPDFSAIPADLLANLPSFDGQTCLDALPFTPIYRPVASSWLPRQPPFPPRPTHTCRRHFLDFMPPSSKRDQVEKWLRDSLQDLIDIRDHGAAVERRRPATVVVSQLDMYPEVRGVVWDCTFTTSSCCEVLDTQRDITTQLNRAYLAHRLRHYPDQRLVSNLVFGVRLEADIELNAVLMPHLVSLPLGFDSVGNELRRMRGLGWYQFFGTFPYWPIICNGQGTTCRKLEPDRHRRTTEAGGPRQEMWDRSGARVLSLNMACKLFYLPAHFASDQRPEMLRWLRAKGLPPPPELVAMPLAEQLRSSKFPKEVKPTLQMMMRDILVLARAAYLLGEPIYVFSDDAKDYFNQLAIAREDLWKLGVVFLGAAADDISGESHTRLGPDTLVIISELRLGFGCHMASNMAQRFSEAIMVMFREDMDAADADFICADCDPRLSFAQWREGRISAAAAATPPTTVEVQLRLYAVHIFTDDPAFVVVGVQRALRLLRVWRSLVVRIGLIMAIPEKRVLGVWAPWLGMVLLPQLGLVVISPDKLLRSAKTLTDAVEGVTTFDVYRSLIGLLEHFRGIYQLGRQVMYGLYEPHNPEHGAAQFGPATPVYPSVLMLKQLRAWLRRVRTAGGVSVLSSIRRTTPSSGLTVCVTADAASDAEAAGIGGFCHGFYWYMPLPIEAVLYLHITALEFLAMAISMIVFARYVRHFERVVLLSDALATPYRLTLGRGKSATLAYAHYLLRMTEEFQLLAPLAECAHLGGDRNLFADAVSRAWWSQLRQLAVQARIRLTELQLLPEARLLFERVLAFEMRRLGRPRERPQRHRLASARRDREPLLPEADAAATDLRRRGEADERRQTAQDGERVHPHPGMEMAATQRLVQRLYGREPGLLAPTGAEQGPALETPTASSQLRLTARLHGSAGLAAVQLHPCVPSVPPTPQPPTFSSYFAAQPSTQLSEICTSDNASSCKRLATRLHQPTSAPATCERPVIGLVSVQAKGGHLVLPAPPCGVRRRQDTLLGAAHRRHVTARAHRLATDTSAGAIRAGVEVLSALLAASADLEDYGINFSTFAKDELAWRSWELFCEDVLETPAIRTVQMVRDDPERETEILGLYTLWIYPQIKPRDRSRRWASPRSAFAKALAIIRVHGRWGVLLPAAKAVRAKLNGLLRSFVVSYGPYALVPSRKEPWLRSMTVKIAALRTPTLPNGLPWVHDSYVALTVIALLTFLLETGFRLGEIVEHPSGELMYLTRGSLVWFFDGVATTDPSVAQLQSVRIGTRVDVRPSRSKSDQWGELHCPYVLSLVCCSMDLLDVVCQLVEVELRLRVRGSARETTPLFATASGGTFTHAYLDRLLTGLLILIVGVARARCYSWHSFRVGLACALRAVGCPPDVTQLICRWMSPASLRVYALKGVGEHTGWLTRARTATVDAVRSVQPPIVDLGEGLSIAGAEFRARGDWHLPPHGPPTVIPARVPALLPPAVTQLAPTVPRRAASSLDLAVGMSVLLPQSLWPDEACPEHSGAGWEAHVLSLTARSAVVALRHATSSGGQPFEDIRLPRSALRELPP